SDEEAAFDVRRRRVRAARCGEDERPSDGDDETDRTGVLTSGEAAPCRDVPSDEGRHISSPEQSAANDEKRLRRSFPFSFASPRIVGSEEGEGGDEQERAPFHAP